MTPDRQDAAHRVRRFESRDAQGSRAIVQQSPEAAQWSDETWRQLHREGPFAWIVESTEGGTVGFLVARILAPDEAEILNLAVAPAKRRLGYATELVQTCIADFSRRKINKIFLEVRESNAAAIGFYEQQGFVRTGRRAGYYQHPAEAAVLLVRILTA